MKLVFKIVPFSVSLLAVVANRAEAAARHVKRPCGASGVQYCSLRGDRRVHVEALQWLNCICACRWRANRHQLHELGNAKRKVKCRQGAVAWATAGGGKSAATGNSSCWGKINVKHIKAMQRMITVSLVLDESNQ